MVILHENAVKLCRAGSCCVLVEKVSEDEFSFTDDYNSSIILTKSEISSLEFIPEKDDKFSISDKNGKKVIFTSEEKNIFETDTKKHFNI
jgi:hypothetical protein